jgi:hypothetical protein
MDKNTKLKAKPQRRVPRKCSCGTVLEGEDAYFWGECNECRYDLPISSQQIGDAGAVSDLRYNGGNFHSGEW